MEQSITHVCRFCNPFLYLLTLLTLISMRQNYDIVHLFLWTFSFGQIFATFVVIFRKSNNLVLIDAAQFALFYLINHFQMRPNLLAKTDKRNEFRRSFVDK